MKLLKLLLKICFASVLILFLSSCSSKIQDNVLNSSKEDVSNLLDKLIQRDKQINKLTKELEACKKAKH